MQPARRLDRRNPRAEHLWFVAVAARHQSRLLVDRAHAAIDRAAAIRGVAGSDRKRRVAASELRARHRRAHLDALVMSHRALADRLAQQFSGRGQPYEDLRQVAYLGLVSAAQRFDAGRGVRFATFARATVLGELKKHFRDHAWQLHVARPVQERYLAVRDTAERLLQETGTAPTVDAIATELGYDVEDVIEALDAGSALHVDSLDAPLPGAEDAYERGELDTRFALIDDRGWLLPALAELPPRERHILRLRFVDGLPQSAIALEVGCSQMHVSRLLARSLAALRSRASTDG